jgi:hypothetical protein
MEGSDVIGGNPQWNQRVAAMTSRSRPLYVLEIPDEKLILTSFYPDKAGVTIDLANLLTQTFWARAAVLQAGLKTIALNPTCGFTQTGGDGDPVAQLPPAASVTRYNFGAAINSCAAYLGWYGYVMPPGAPDLADATSLTLVMYSSMETSSYAPYGEIDWSVLGTTPYLGTSLPSGWFQALNSNTPGWSNLLTSVQLWPGNADVGASLPDLNRIELRITENGSATASVPAGITLGIVAQLVLTYA